jgi:predicted nucleic acid-binding protein
MTVVSDTSPINYLVLIDCVHILPDLFERVLVPHAVRDELRAAGAPDKVENWTANPPDWFEVQQAGAVDPSLNRLGEGEREAISLAQSTGASLILIDEIEGRRAALERGLKVAGTVGVLELAAARGLIDPAETVKRLRQTNFRISPPLLQRLLRRR